MSFSGLISSIFQSVSKWWFKTSIFKSFTGNLKIKANCPLRINDAFVSCCVESISWKRKRLYKLFITVSISSESLKITSSVRLSVIKLSNTGK